MDDVLPGNRNELHSNLHVIKIYQLGVYSKWIFYLAGANCWKTLRRSSSNRVHHSYRMVVFVFSVQKESVSEGLIIFRFVLCFPAPLRKRSALHLLQEVFCASKTQG